MRRPVWKTPSPPRRGDGSSSSSLPLPLAGEVDALGAQLRARARRVGEKPIRSTSASCGSTPTLPRKREREFAHHASPIQFSNSKFQIRVRLPAAPCAREAVAPLYLSRLRGGRRARRAIARKSAAGGGKAYPLDQRVLRKHPHPNPPPQAGEGVRAPCVPDSILKQQIADTRSQSRGARRPGFCHEPRPINQRAWGTPGARCTRGLVCKG